MSYLLLEGTGKLLLEGTGGLLLEGGSSTATGAASGSFTIAGSATGLVAVSGSASGSFTVSGSATGAITAASAAIAPLTIASVDLETTLGFQFTDDGSYLDGAVTIPGEVEIPTMPGVIFAGPNRVPVREFTLKGYLDGTTRAAVRTNLQKLKALVGSEDVDVTLGGWTTVSIAARCVRFEASDGVGPTRANVQNEIPVRVAMTFRASCPYWEETTDQAVAFTTSATAMPQGTAPSEPVLTTDTASAGADTLVCKDYLGTTLWTAVLAARSSGERYRITTALGTMTLEKYSSGVWANSDASLTSGVFPKPLPSSAVGYQTAAWPTLQSSAGNWTATYPKRHR